jgi:hypothetical protein
MMADPVLDGLRALLRCGFPNGNRLEVSAAFKTLQEAVAEIERLQQRLGGDAAIEINGATHYAAAAVTEHVARIEAENAVLKANLEELHVEGFKLYKADIDRVRAENEQMREVVAAAMAYIEDVPGKPGYAWLKTKARAALQSGEKDT